MRYRCLMTGLMLAAVIVFAAGSPNSTILIDDFEDFDPADWTQDDFTGIGSLEVIDGEYYLETMDSLPVDDPSVGTIVSTWQPSRGQPRFSNGTLRGTVRANTEGTTAGFLLRANDEVHTDYGFYGSDGFGTFYIERFDGSASPPQTILAMADPDEFPFEVGQDYHIQASVLGHNLRMKVWKVGDPEPAEPLLTVTDKELKPTSGTLICVIVFFDPDPLMDQGVTEVQVSGTFDDITFTPGLQH